MNKAAAVQIPISYVQARGCLCLSKDNRVHSFLMSAFLSGADLDLSRTEEMLASASESKKLFLSDALSSSLHHDVVAWDQKYHQWIYLECDKEKAEQLWQLLR